MILHFLASLVAKDQDTLIEESLSLVEQSSYLATVWYVRSVAPKIGS